MTIERIPSDQHPITVSSSITQSHIMTTAKGGGIVFAGKSFELGSRFVIGILLARFLGAEQLGLYNLALTVGVIAAAVALLGLGTAMVRYVSIAVRRQDDAALWGTLQVGLGLGLPLSFLIGASIYVLADFIAVQFFQEPALAPLLRFISLIVPLMVLNSILAAATQGFKKMQYTVVAQDIVQSAVKLMLIIGLALVGLNATRALFVTGLSKIVVFLILLYYLNRLFPLKRPLQSAQRDMKTILGFSLPVYLSGLIQMFGGNIQTVLLGLMNTITNVGIFVVANQINMVGRMFHGAIVTSSMPVVSEIHDQNDRQQMGHIYQTVTKWTFTVNFPFFLIIILFPSVILSIFGQSFIGGATALVILAWANLIQTGTGICGVVLDMTGNTVLKMINSLVAFGVTLGLNLLLIPYWGLVGAAVATLAAAIIVNLLRLTEVFVLFRLQPYSLGFFKPVGAGLIALFFVYQINSFFPGRIDLINTVVSILILLAVYSSLILLFGLSKDDRDILVSVGHRIKTIWPK